MSAGPSFFAELRRRNVYKVGAMYAVAGWLLVQVVTQVFPIFDVSALVQRVIVLVIVAGFPVALVFSWIYELTPQGIVRTDEVAPDASIARHTGQQLNRAIIGVLLIAVLVLLANKFWPHAAPPAAEAGNPAAETIANDKSIAVLPFENLSDDKANAYFAVGIQDEILTRLAKIGALSVVSRTSTARYASSPDNLPEIARQLGVANILEGSVQKAGDTVHINVQLIRGATDKHLWAEAYDRKLDNIFGVEGEVAGAIAAALNARLSGGERQALADKPTENAEAYDAYLRGRAIAVMANGQGPADLHLQAELFGQAVKLDPNFAEAWSALARADAALYFEQYDASPERREAARQAVDTALKLQPHAPEPLLAQAFYQYWVLRDYDTARSLFEELRAALPNAGDVPLALALINRREGRWDDCLAFWAEAARRDPHNLDYKLEWSQTALAVRRYPEVLRIVDQALDVDPGEEELIATKMWTYQATGDLDRAAALAAGVRPDGTDDTVAFVLGNQFLLTHQYPQAVAFYQSVLAMPGIPDLLRAIYRVHLASAQQYAGDAAAARVSFLQVRQELQAVLSVQSENHRVIGALALASAGLGDFDAALKYARRALQLLPPAKDALDGPGYALILAQVQAQSGDHDAAIASLPGLLKAPAFNDYNLVLPVTPAVLQLSPVWDPLRGDPRFRRLLADGAALPVQTRP